MIGDEIKSNFGAYSIRYALAAYALDKDPQHLWTVWRVCRKTGIEIPSVVLSYIDGVAGKLDPSSPNHSTEGRIENRVRNAVLGDKKAPKPADTLKHVQLAQTAFRLSPNLTLSEDQVVKLALQFHKEVRTIYRWLEDARALIHEG